MWGGQYQVERVDRPFAPGFKRRDGCFIALDVAQLVDAIHQAVARDRQAREQRAQNEALRRRYRTLTPRERDVMARVVAGLLNKQVAGELGTSEAAVKVHRQHVMAKMEAGSLAALVRMADRLGIPTPQL